MTDLTGFLECFLITNGRSSFAYALASVEQQEDVKLKHTVLKDLDHLDAYYAMIERSTARYTLRVDDDMLLHPQCVDYVQKTVRGRWGPRTALMYWLLYEPWGRGVIRSLKVYDTGIARRVGFRQNAAGKVDRCFREDVQGRFELVEDKSILAVHACPGYEEMLRYCYLRGEDRDRGYFKERVRFFEAFAKPNRVDMAGQFGRAPEQLRRINRMRRTPFYAFCSRKEAPVGHVIRGYPGSTQTFVHSFLTHARRFRPLVMTDVASDPGVLPVACSYLVKRDEVVSMGPQTVRAFLGQMDFPNCFERLIRERGMGLLHAHFGTTGCLSLRLKRRLDIPLVTSFYGVDASAMSRWPEWQRPLKALFSEGDRMLVLGADMARRLRDMGCPAEKIRVQHLGVDVEGIAFRPRGWPERDGPVTLLYCGRLVEKKGVLYALEAFAGLADRWENVRFRIVGEGPLRPAVERALGTLGLRDRVVLTGALSHPEALEEMRRAHLFLLPGATGSDGDMEGTPTVLLEAQASGLPVVSTRHADIPEVVRDGEAGYLAPERDVRALTDRLEALLFHPELWGEMGRAGRAHVATQYDIRRGVSRLEAVYAGLIGR